jgi:hypothetical protein
MWLMRTRPDMHFCINLLTRFLKCATDAHVAIATGRPLRYLAHTTTFGIVFAPGKGEWDLSADADADLAGDIHSARSTSGRGVRLGEFGNISSSSHLDKRVCTSTGQAETYSYQDLCKEIVWVRQILRELGYERTKPTKCRSDNDGVLKQAVKAINHATAKHYRIAQGYIKMLTGDKVIEPERVSTDENPADTFTKALPKASFEKHRLAIMGPQDPPTSK